MKFPTTILGLTGGWRFGSIPNVPGRRNAIGDFGRLQNDTKGAEMKIFARCILWLAAFPAVAGIVELSWIETLKDAQQWILSGYAPAATDRIEFKFLIPEIFCWHERSIACAFGRKRESGSFGFGYWYNDMGYATHGCPRVYAGTWPQGFNSGNAAEWDLKAGVEYGVAVDPVQKKMTLRFGETVLETQIGVGAIDPVAPFLFFAAYRKDNDGAIIPEGGFDSYTQVRLYHFRGYGADGALKFDAVPAARTGEGMPEYGLYDRIGQVFYPGNGNAPLKIPAQEAIPVRVDRADYGSDEAAGEALAATLEDPMIGEGARVTVASGTKDSPKRYRINRSLTLKAACITLEGDGEDAEGAVIDAGGETAAIFAPAASHSCRVTGVTVVNARGHWSESDKRQYAGGITLLGECSVVSNCVVRNCVNGGDGIEIRGGGVCIAGSEMVDTLVENCVVSNEQNAVTGYGNAMLYGGGACAETMRRKSDNKAFHCRVLRTEISNCRGYNNQTNYGGKGVGRVKGGGLYASGEESVVAECHIHHNGFVMGEAQVWLCGQGDGRVSGWANYGAGVALDGGASIYDSLVLTNSSPAGFTGVWFGSHKGRAAGCTIAGNAMKSKYIDFGAPVGVGPVGSELRNCLIDGNCSWSGQFDNYAGGAGIQAGAQVTDCVFSGNAASNCWGGAITMNAGNPDSPAVLSNVVFRGNSYCAIGLRSTKYGALEVRDCWFDGNEGKEEAGSAIVASLNADGGAVFRNCYVLRNHGGNGTVSVASSHNNGGTARLEFENCTFAANTNRGAVLWHYGCGYSDNYNYNAANYYPVNCVFAGNCGAGGNSNREIPGLPAKYSIATNATHCYDTCAGAGFPSDMSRDYRNRTGADFPPGFRDAAAGNYALRPQSRLRNGGLRREWMGDGTRKSAVQDMGDGAWTESPLKFIRVRGKTLPVGVTVVRCNPAPRLDWTAQIPDIGCSEYFVNRYFHIVIR